MADEPTPRLPDPARPRLPKSGTSSKSGRSQEQANAATFGAFFGLGLVSLALIGMVALVLPQVAGLVVVLFAAIGFFAFHYIVWGWWLPKKMKRDDDEKGVQS